MANQDDQSWFGHDVSDVMPKVLVGCYLCWMSKLRSWTVINIRESRERSWLLRMSSAGFKVVSV